MQGFRLDFVKDAGSTPATSTIFTIQITTTMKPLSETYKELGIEFTLPIEIRDTKGRRTYYEGSDGRWNKREYDDDGNQTYYENSDGYWNKREYDSKGNQTYYENSDGHWFRQEYDSDGNKTYSENSEGFWCKKEYDSDGNQTYSENSDGYWYKKEYDTNGKTTYFEDSKGHKTGTPRSKSCDGKVVEIDGQKYELKLKS